MIEEKLEIDWTDDEFKDPKKVKALIVTFH